jgi:Ca2+-binding EF-hand superfamily protein
MEKHYQISNFEEIKAKVVNMCRTRSSNGLRGLRILFRAMDRNRNNSLEPMEFKYAMRDFGVDLSEVEISQILKYFDTNKDGKLSFDEFLRAIRGELNERRAQMVMMAYNVLDKDGSGQVTIRDIELAYDTSFHPDFQSGRKTNQEVLRDFMGVWETHKKDGIVTVEEFMDYYKDISASIDGDDYFELVIRNAWHIDGGEGWCANTTIKRVLKTNPDGSQEVVKVENDMDKNTKSGPGYAGMEI